MTIPDPLVYGNVGLIVGGVIWGIKQIAKGEKGEKGEAGKPGMTVREYKELSEVLITSLNGRYMMAGECRGRFENLEKKVDEIKDHLRIRK